MSSEALAKPEVCGSGTGYQPVPHGQDAHATRSLIKTSSEFAIQTAGLGKCYHIYDKPRDRLLQMLARGRKQYYREFWALKDVSFEVRKGETVGIIGRNGSGKSTLLQLVCGVLAQTEGTVRAHGRVAALLELGAGFNPEFTGRENVYLSAAIMGLEPAEVDARFAEIAAFADIGDFMAQPVKTYSSGMYVRLAFAVAIHLDPEILILDEVLAVGDVRFQLKCGRKLDELRAAGKTILLVSHSAADVVRLCDRAVWLDGGRLRRAGPAREVVEAYLAWTTHDTGVQASGAVASAPAGVGAQDLLVPVPRDAFITGDGGAEITAVGLLAEQDRRLTLLRGGERVRVAMRLTAKTRIQYPYYAFQVVNAKGTRVLGSNTMVLEQTPTPLEAGQTITVHFTFTFPELANGRYLLAVGVADGQSAQHVRHQLIADAYEFEMASASPRQGQDVLLKLPDCALTVA
ncbi:MAG: ABC transporter ATP-binding protein [Candidatus Marinimicrobia bacterium]|nr:ABC transporter ATP-binding protein [Candidatus Neomarinimicrobiota bacterium]